MSQIQFFSSQDREIQLELNLEQETVWLSQAQMAELFGKNALQLPNIWETSLKFLNLNKVQYVPFWNILRVMAKFINAAHATDGINQA